jgi:hypothetical protein
MALAGVRFVRASGAPDAEVFCIARPLCRDARTPRHRVRLEPASRGVLRAHTRAGVAGADAGGGFCWLRRAGPQARQCAKLLTRRRICRCGDHAVRGGAERQGVAAPTFDDLRGELPLGSRRVSGGRAAPTELWPSRRASERLDAPCCLCVRVCVDLLPAPPGTIGPVAVRARLGGSARSQVLFGKEKRGCVRSNLCITT